MEYSKRTNALVWAVTLLLTLLAVVMPAMGMDASGVLEALPYAWGAATAVQTMYLWKAKNENRHKYAMKYVDSIAEQYGIESAIQIAEVVLNH